MISRSTRELVSTEALTSYELMINVEVSVGYAEMQDS